MEKTKIQWADATVNFWSGCKKVSEGCKGCYAYRILSGQLKDPKIVIKAGKHKFDEALTWEEPKRIFTCSMSDFFIEEADDWREEAWDVIRKTPHHNWLILTKRPERIKKCLPKDWGEGWDNVWLGVSVETQKYMNRAYLLAEIPAKVRFISAEPLLEELDFTKVPTILDKFHWCIVGGESGNEKGQYMFRECNEAWIEKIITDLKDSQVKVFVKQMGTHLKKQMGLMDRHGGDIDEWAPKFQIREYPSLNFALPIPLKSIEVSMESKSFLYAEDLLAIEQDEVPMLLPPFLEKGACAALIGASEVGKSLWCLNLAVAICSKQEEVFGFKIDKTYGKAILVSTEDSPIVLKVRLRSILNGEALTTNSMRFILDPKNVKSELVKLLKLEKVDLVVMDTFGDFFRGNINDSIAIREFLEPFKAIAAEYGCVILFLHHIGKGKENNASPSKNDSLGSQGLESTCRTMLGLNKKANGMRELSILKANNTLDKFKENKIELELLEKGGFKATGITKPHLPNKSAAEITAETIQMVKEMYKVEKSLKKTSDALKEKGIYFDKNKVGLIIKMNPSVQSPSKNDDGQVKKAA